MRKRITALLLAFVMTASLLPVTAQAVSPEAEAQAAVITTAAEFAAMAPDGNYRLEATSRWTSPTAGHSPAASTAPTISSP